MKLIKRAFAACLSVLGQMKWWAKLALVIVAACFFAGSAIVVTGQPGFCDSCHIMNSYYASWQDSKHSEVNCLDCHLQPGFAGYAKGKINGLAQAVDCMVGRIGTKPNATVMDTSCLRSECHNTEELVSKEIDYKTMKFNHKNHIAKVIDGIQVSCGTCHSHFEGDEHFDVNTGVCFTCHFLRAQESNTRLVQTDCRSCHEVPDKTIERGLVKINHAEFVSYEASCDESCHKKQIEQVSQITDSVCLNCHDFSKEHATETEELHASHTGGEKVECFACHAQVSHARTETFSVTGMMDCRSCHSDTHDVQLRVYTADEHTMEAKGGRILSPMFLTHVECTGCHIEQAEISPGSINSIGKVARAVPQACDKCHEQGTGQRYIPFWQQKIKKLYGQVNRRVEKLETKAQLGSDEETAMKIRETRSLLESVRSDGSWGVHNLKYTEAILLKANEIATEVGQR
jgi:nitrate/TMAO reductase-like tetraheme cytochrome c subunit